MNDYFIFSRDVTAITFSNQKPAHAMYTAASKLLIVRADTLSVPTETRNDKLKRCFFER